MKFNSKPSYLFQKIPFPIGIVFLFFMFSFTQKINGQVEHVKLFKNPLLEKAQHLHVERKYKEAEKLVDECLEKFQLENHPREYAEALLLKAKVSVHQHRVDESLTWYDSSAHFAKLNNLNFHQATALNSLGDIYNYKNENDLAISKAKEVLTLSELPSDVYSMSYNSLSTAFLSKGMIDSSDKYTIMAFEIDSINNNIKRLASDYARMGKMNARKGKNKKAITLFIKAADLVTPERSAHKTHIYLLLSDAFFQIKNLHKAEEYAIRSKEMAENFKLKSARASALMRLGRIAEINGQYQSAIDLYSEALIHFKKSKNTKSAVGCYLGLTKSHLELSEIEDAKIALDSVQIKVVESDNDQLILKYYIVESLFNLKNKNYSKALTMLSKADEKSKSLKNIFRQRDVYRIYANYYQDKGQMDLAYDNLQNYHTMKDSISQIQQAYITHDLDSKYQKVEQDLKIQKLDQETILMNQKLSRRNWAIGVGGFMLLLISLLSFVIYNLYKKNKEKTVELSLKNNQLQKTLNEKGFLLKEIHHRVKNNLQIVSSLLALQARNVQDEVALDALKEGQSRVRSMALIHQNLYQDDDLIGVEAKAYIEKLSAGLFHSYNIDQEKIQLHINIEDLKLDVDTIIPLGLIINELITNALKYAFEKDSIGNIHLTLQEQKEGLVFSLQDDGIGLPSEFEIEKNKSLGYRLIKAFSQKLKANLLVEGTSGTKITLTIPTT